MRALLLVFTSLVVLGGHAHALPASQWDAYGGTVGVKLLDLSRQTIGFSYRLRVNAASGLGSKKVVFVGLRTHTPGAPIGTGVGTIQMDVFSHWVEYQDDLGHAGWPERGYPHPTEPSLWLRNVDYDGQGRVGVRPMSEASRLLFPRQTAGIDRVHGARAGLTSIAAIHQGSILARDVRVTAVRQPLAWIPSQLNWGHRFTRGGGVTPMLPAGNYWPWLVTVETSGEPTTKFLFLIDASRGQYAVMDGGVSIRTEFFFRPDMPQNADGALQVFVWDVQTLDESDATWTPRARWDYSEDVTIGETAAGYGFRRATYRGMPVLEIGYSLGDYAMIGDVLEIGPRVSR
jgi:hypothetical protein